MSVNFGKEYKKFRAEQKRLRKYYEALGMSKEVIDALYEFDKMQFCEDIAFKRRIQYLEVSDEDDIADEDKSPLLKRFLEVISVSDEFHTSEKFWWLQEIGDSVKHTGDRRYLCSMAYYNIEPIEMINTIFRVVLPNYGYAVREAQINLCIDMFKGLTKKQVAICEAEVGTGKTLAYLVAGIVAKYYYKQQHQITEPVTISTSSIELQRTLVRKEIPKLSRMLMEYFIIPKPISVSLRKGRENYICRCRFNDYLSKIEQYPEKYSKTLAVLKKMKVFSRGIDLDNYEINRSIKKKINNIGGCHKCADKENCKYILMTKGMNRQRDLDFQVTNHNLLLTSLKLSEDESELILLSSTFVVVDEAHKFKEAAQDVFGSSFSVADVIDYLEDSKGKCMFKKNTAKYKGLLSKLLKLSEELIKTVAKKSEKQNSDDYSGGIVKVDSGISLYIKRILETLVNIEDMKLPYEGRQACIYARLFNTLNNFLEYQNNLTWVTVDEDRGIVFNCTPLDIAELMYTYVWNRGLKYVLTSGTMSDGFDFEYFKMECGLDYVPMDYVSESTTSSPFDYKNNARLYIPNELPKIKNNPNYINEISDICIELIQATNGHTVILFTSYGALNSVYAVLKKQLKDFQLIKMSRGNKTAINGFQKANNAILFAAGSMWEGIDIAGDKLSSVIIIRLPFPQRSLLMEEKKKDCFSTFDFVEKFCVPNMLIKLRQGVGRLIRTETDTGVVTILDERVARGGRYRHRVFNSFKKLGKAKSIVALRLFLEKVKPKEYWENKNEKGE